MTMTRDIRGSRMAQGPLKNLLKYIPAGPPQKYFFLRYKQYSEYLNLKKKLNFGQPTLKN